MCKLVSSVRYSGNSTWYEDKNNTYICCAGLSSQSYKYLQPQHNIRSKDFHQGHKARLKCPCPMYRGRPALGTFLCPGRSALCTFLDQGQPAPGTQGYQPWVQDGNSGLTALGTFLYRRQPALCTFLDRGRPAPGTQGYQPWVQDGNSGLAALGTFLYRRHPALCTFLDQGRQALGTRR